MESRTCRIIKGPSVNTIFLASVVPKIFLVFTLENGKKINIHPDTCHYNEIFEIEITGKIKNHPNHNSALITYDPNEQNGYITIFSK